MNHHEILQTVTSLLLNEKKPIKSLNNVCTYLQKTIKHYDWVGFYFHHETKPELHLKAYAGAPTDHTIIPFGKGICGQVAELHQNFLVDNVHAQSNYIACSIDVKSELVVPLFRNGKNVGQIDIDSHTLAAFSSADETLLEEVNKLVSKHLNWETFLA